MCFLCWDPPQPDITRQDVCSICIVAHLSLFSHVPAAQAAYKAEKWSIDQRTKQEAIPTQR